MSDPAVETKAVTETSVDDIATELKLRRDQGQRPVLFLGSRAGGFFGNEFLYETLKQFSLKNFEKLSKVEKFGECHTVLKHFTESDRHHILMDAQATLTDREEDRLLSELVKAGFFEVIISTNIDRPLEDAYSACGLWKPNDYQVFIAGSENIAGIEHDKARYGDIVKVFGDLDSRHYSITGDLKVDDSLQKFLESKLAGDVLMVGYDPIWDHGIEQVFPPEGKTVWYVNETALSFDTHLAAVLEQRPGKRFQNKKGSYKSFIKILYDSLSEELRRNEAITTPSSLQPQSPTKDKKAVFISYSSKDEKYMDRLQTHLKGYLYLLKGTYKDTVTTWDETKIQSGGSWKEEIKKALTQAEVAILLISAPKPSSPSVHTDELSLIQDVALKENVKILPIILDQPSLSNVNHQMLDQYKALNDSVKPLKKMNSYEREVLWNKLAEHVYSILDSSSI